jgi:hypothetical protein
MAILFVRLRPRGRFAFRLIPRHSKDYSTVNRLLRLHGQQGGAERRFIIGGGRADSELRRIRGLLPGIHGKKS